jgi:hypothetical protein
MPNKGVHLRNEYDRILEYTPEDLRELSIGVDRRSAMRFLQKHPSPPMIHGLPYFTKVVFQISPRLYSNGKVISMDSTGLMTLVYHLSKTGGPARVNQQSSPYYLVLSSRVQPHPDVRGFLSSLWPTEDRNLW